MSLNFNKLLIVAGLLSVGVISVYYYNLGHHKISDDPTRWAEFGDYLGGVLNPFLAFCSLVALLYTINLQREELTLSRKELARSAIAQTKTAEFAKNQNDITNKQIEILERNEKKSDIQKIIQSSEAKVAELFNKEVRYSSAQGSVKIKKIILIVDGASIDDPNISDAKRALKDDLEDLVSEINIIKNLAREFSELAGHDYLENYYKTLFNKIENGLEKLK